MSLRCGLIAACLGGAALMAEGKLESGTLRLGGQNEEDRWGYLGKFGYAVGSSGTYEVRFRVRPGSADAAAAVPVDLEVFLDEQWDYALTLPACKRASDGQAKRTFPAMTVGSQGEWGPWTKGKVAQNVRPHIWYFAASSCGRASGRSSGGMSLDFEVRLRQFDGSELGVELRWMPCVSAAVLLCLTAFLAPLGLRCRAAARSMGSLHPVILALAAAVALQWGALLLEVLHLWAYRVNGTGAHVADALSGALDMLSQVVTASLLIAIARGYSLACPGARGLSGLQAAASVVAALHVALVLLDKLGGESAHEHHENGGVLGFVLLAARVLLFAWFTKEAGELRAVAGLKLQAFLGRFQAAGSAYLLSYPALFIAVQAFAPYLRHPLLQVGLMAAQACSALWLAQLFLSKGSYYEVSSMSGSLLPTKDFCHGAGLDAPVAGTSLSLRRRGGC